MKKKLMMLIIVLVVLSTAVVLSRNFIVKKILEVKLTEINKGKVDIKDVEFSPIDKKIVIATGTLAYDFMKKISKLIERKFKKLEIQVIAIENNFFGNKITVSGLITGFDLIEGLKGINTDKILIPKSMMKSCEDIFLDNVSLRELEEELDIPVKVLRVSGKEFIEFFKGEVKI